MVNNILLLVILSHLTISNASLLSARTAALPPKVNIEPLGRTSSNFPNIFRDGGGGGRVNGEDVLIFSDGIYTTDGDTPDTKNPHENWANFTSNSIARSNWDGKGVTSLQDFGTAVKGPNQQIPYFYSNGENDENCAVWPNQGIATLCGGVCGVSFPVVVDRTEIAANRNGDLYNTGIEITLTSSGPVVRRPTQALFNANEPLFGSFGTLVGNDGYFYLFATGKIGLKMARVLQLAGRIAASISTGVAVRGRRSCPLLVTGRQISSAGLRIFQGHRMAQGRGICSTASTMAGTCSCSLLMQQL